MISKIGAIAVVTFREGIRNRALLGILAVAILLGFVYLAFVPLFAFDTGKVITDLGFASITLSGLAIVVFMGISLLTRDIHQRSVCLILARPVSRTTYVIGKFYGLAATIGIAVLMIAGIALATGWLGVWLVPEIKAPRHFSFLVLFITVAFQYLSLLILMAIAFLFTVLTTNEYLSMLFTFCVYVIGHSLETVVKVMTEGQFVNADPTHLQLMQILTWVFPNLSAFDLKVHVAYGLILPIQSTLWTLAYGIFYILLILMLTIFSFSRKEIR
ncbi:MAG: ABC transporter permease [Desulfobacteraceae bacterium]|nr:MAG: ABC transporter permease [Desulfobacteraceae bacterium]